MFPTCTSTDMPTYEWQTWSYGDEDCEPPEPGKAWLTILEDGEEYATIVLRTDAPHLSTPAAVLEAQTVRESRADRIVAALNAYREED